MSKKLVKTVDFVNHLAASEKLGEKFDYFKLSLLCLNSPAKGLNIEQMKERIELIDMLKPKDKNGILAIFKRDKDAFECVSLTVKQLNILITSLREMPWNIVDEKIVEFSDYVMDLKETF